MCAEKEMSKAELRNSEDLSFAAFAKSRKMTFILKIKEIMRYNGGNMMNFARDNTFGGRKIRYKLFVRQPCVRLLSYTIFK